MYLMLEMLSKMSDPDMLKSLKHLLVQVKVLLRKKIGNKKYFPRVFRHIQNYYIITLF